MLPEPPPAVSPVVSPVQVLRAWDDRRAAAWAAGDAAALRALYAPEASAARADTAMLRAWAARDLRVEELQMQLLSVRVLTASGERLRLRVTDRVAGAVAVGAGLRQALPADRATTRTVVLRVVAGEWRVVSVS